MPTQDDEFIKRLRETFNVEAEEHLQIISAALLELEKLPASVSPVEKVESVYREAHSLKGAARAVDLAEIESICQSLETVFAAWKRQQSAPTPQAFDALHHALDTIRKFLATDPGETPNQQQHNDALVRLARLQSQVPAAVPAQAEPEQTHIQPAEPEQAPVVDTVRISVAKLDARLLQAEDMLSLKSLAAQRADELREMSDMFQQWQREWAKVSAEARTLRQAVEKRKKNAGQSAPVSAGMVDFLDWNGDYLHSLENRLVSLAARADQDRHAVGKRVDDLLEDSKKLLMLPFATLAGMFPKLIRDLCRDQAKEAELIVQGSDVEMDKRILEEMKDALIHVFRNCIDHGVELPAERARLNKPIRATITIAVSQVNGNKVQILVSDDGAGIDSERVKSAAVRQGILSEESAHSLSEADALRLVFRSEISTSPIVTALSGRGLGMAIVRAKTEKLGGTVLIESQRGIGTTLRMILPLTLATFRGILVSAGDMVFVIPTLNVERVLRIKSTEIQTVENRETISIQGRALSFARLDAVLSLPRKPAGTSDAAAPIPVVILHSSDQRIAFAVDEILREEEILVKPLRKPLLKVRNIAGATVLGSRKVAPILNVSDLIKSARTTGGGPAVAFPAEQPAQTVLKKVLVVEDSITSRMLLKGILESAGYLVKTAVDGAEAFAVLREEVFDVLVSDVEMPRMNGFDLTGQVRADKRLANLPVVLVTALESREERERGIDAGANAYIIKSSFDQSNLLEVVRRLI